MGANTVLAHKLADGLEVYSLDAIKASIAESTLDEEQIRAILLKKGLTGETLKTTTAELANATATNRMAREQRKATGSTLGLGTAIEGLGIKLKEAILAHPYIATITGIIAAFALISKFTAKLSDDNEKLEKRIKKTSETYSDTVSQLDKVNQKLEENKKRIEEINKLENPTYIDEQELKKLKEQNTLLKEQRTILENSKSENAKKKNDALTKKFEREYTSNDARNEDLTKSDGIVDIATFKGLRGLITASRHTKTKDDKLQNAFNRAKVLNQLNNLSTEEFQKYSEAITNRVQYDYNPHNDNTPSLEKSNNAIEQFGISVEDAMSIGVIRNKLDLDELIEANNDKLAKERDDLLKRLAEFDETDPNYQSEGAQEILNRLTKIYKYTNPDEWIADSIGKTLNGTDFSDISKTINKKLASGEEITYDDLISDNSYDGLIKSISQTLYNATDDESIKKAASYLANYLSTIVTSGEVKPYVSFDTAFNDSAFSETKTKLLELATAGELSVETISSTTEYNTLLTQTGLTAGETCKKINDLITAEDKLTYVTNGLSSLSNLYKQANENGFVDIDAFTGLDDKFKGLDSYNNFVNILGSGQATADEMQRTFNKLTSEYLIQTDALHGLNEENKNLYINQLKQHGITNAEDIVTDYNATLNQNKKLLDSSEDEYINYLDNKENASEESSNTLLSQNNILITALSEPYKDDYDNWCNLLKQKSEAYKKFVTTMSKAQFPLLSSNNVTLNEEGARKIVDEAQGKIPKDLTSNNINTHSLLPIGDAYNKEISAYTSEEIETAIQYLETSQNATDRKDTLLGLLQAQSGILDELSFTNYDGNTLGESGNSFKGSKSFFDYIEIRLKRLQTKISNFVNKVTDYSSAAVKRSALTNAVSTLFEQINTQVAAYSAYMQKANEVNLDESLKKKIREGGVDILPLEDNETQYNLMMEYQNWYEKAIDAENEIDALKSDQISKMKQLTELEAGLYQHRIDYIDFSKNYQESMINLKEAQGKELNSKDYQDIIALNRQKLDLLAQQNSVYAEAQFKFDTSSNDWQDLQNKIENNVLEYNNILIDIEEKIKAIEELPIKRIQKWLDYLDSVSSEYSSRANYKQNILGYNTTADYMNQIRNNNSRLSSMEKQKKDYFSRYLKAQSLGNATAMQEYAQKYHELENSILSLKNENLELKNSMRDNVLWKPFQLAHEESKKVIDNLSKIDTLINDDNLFDENGKLTSMGSSKIAVLIKQYESAKKEVKNYMKDLNELNLLYKQGYYNNSDYNKKLTELQQELLGAANSVKNYTDSLTNLYINQGQSEIDALKKLVKSRQEALNKKKEYYDYDKTIRTKTKDIQSLETQKTALEATKDTLEKRKKLLELEEQLKEKREDLYDTEYEHNINLVINGLDDFVNDIQSTYDKYTDELKNSLELQTDIINNANEMYASSYTSIQKTLNKILSTYGIDTSNSDFTKLLNDSLPALQNTVNLKPLNLSSLNGNSNTSVVNVKYDNLININGNANSDTVSELKKLTPRIADEVTKKLVNDLKKNGYK